jgi:putative transcriptional regulator
VAIRAIRASLGLTQLDFAVAIGTTPSSVSRWERGMSEPELTIVQVKRLCKLAGKSLEDLPDFLGQPIPQQKTDAD